LRVPGLPGNGEAGAAQSADAPSAFTPDGHVLQAPLALLAGEVWLQVIARVPVRHQHAGYLVELERCEGRSRVQVWRRPEELVLGAVDQELKDLHGEPVVQRELAT